MAILNNLWMRGSKKKLGGTVIYNSMGQTIQRELAASVSNPRTESQMSQRVRWANLVNFYRVAKPMMKYAFENKKRTQSDYNALMSANVTASPIALTKQEAAAGACVVAPYTLTMGSLPSISVNECEEGWYLDLLFSTAFDWESGTIAEFSAILVSLNPGLKYGDQLSFIRFTQNINGTTGIPYVVLRKYEVVLSPTNQDLLANYFPLDIISVWGVDETTYLEVMNNGGTGAWAMIVSRTTGGRTQVSTQQLVLVNMQATLQAYSSEAQITEAIKSYGVSEDAFLSATSANYAQSQPILYTIMSAAWDGKTFFPQSYAPAIPNFLGKQIVLEFNQPLKDAPRQVNIGDFDDVTAQQNFTVEGSKVIIPSAKWNAGSSPTGIQYFEVYIGDNGYTLYFQAQQGGLE